MGLKLGFFLPEALEFSIIVDCVKSIVVDAVKLGQHTALLRVEN